jgi:GINS complex subunit 4
MSHYLDELDDNISNSHLKSLKQSWVSERGAPDLFEFNYDAFEFLQKEITRKQDELDDEKDDILSHIYTLEVDRMKYLISSYLRTRLTKIEKFSGYYLEEDRKGYLSPSEEVFAKKLSILEKQVFDSVLLSNLSTPIGHDEKLTYPVPDLNGYVYARVVDNIGEIEIDGDMVDLVKGLKIVVRYENIKGWIHSKQIELI